MVSPQVVFMFLAAAVAALIAYVKNLQAKRRTAELAAYCRAKGWRFSARDPYRLVDRWNGPPFNAGGHRHVRNVITTEAGGRVVVAFDYSYVVRQGKHSKTYEYAVVALGLPCRLPDLHVGPEHLFARLGTVLGMADIELESEEFNRRFRVRCSDAKFAHDVLTPRTMHALLGAGPVEFRFAGTDALCFELRHLHPDWVLARVHMLRTVLSGIPSFVWRDSGAA